MHNYLVLNPKDDFTYIKGEFRKLFLLVLGKTRLARYLWDMVEPVQG